MNPGQGGQPYNIHLDVKFPPLEIIDVAKVVAENREVWFNQTLTRVNDCVARIGVLHGEFHWHSHTDEDEFFLVLDGELLLDLEGKTLSLKRWMGATVPRGVIHRTRAPEKAVVLMVEGAGVSPTGD